MKDPRRLFLCIEIWQTMMGHYTHTQFFLEPLNLAHPSSAVDISAIYWKTILDLEVVMHFLKIQKY